MNRGVLRRDARIAGNPDSNSVEMRAAPVPLSLVTGARMWYASIEETVGEEAYIVRKNGLVMFKDRYEACFYIGTDCSTHMRDTNIMRGYVEKSKRR